MAAFQIDRGRTLEFAERAFSYITQFNLGADPHTYEVMYVYAAGVNASLNKDFNDLVGQYKKITQEDAARLYKDYISPERLEDNLLSTGQDTGKELAKIMEALAKFGSVNDEVAQKIAAASPLNKDDPESIARMAVALEEGADAMRLSQEVLRTKVASSEQEINKMQSEMQAVRESSLKDSLTGIFNRKHFDIKLASVVEAAGRDGTRLSLLICDIDHFKSFNDSFGHSVGDQVLRMVAKSLHGCVRNEDTAARYGGEEFGVILPESTIENATKVAEILRKSVMHKELKQRSTGANLGRITMSVGVAEFTPGDTAESLVERADTALYAAKRNGRNRVVSEKDPEFEQMAKRQAGEALAVSM